MNGQIRNLPAMLIVALAFMLGACSNGQDSKTPDDPLPEAPTGFVATGVITGLGSVYIDGVRYDTAAAEVTMDDAPATQAELRVGQYVEIKGHEHEGARFADLVHYHNLLEGPVTSIDLANDSFVAMGQTVLVTPDTAIGDNVMPASLEGLTIGDVVEVSGPVPVTGPVIATRIDIKPDGGPFDVTGYVTNVTSNVTRFSINSLQIDYSAANMTDFSAGVPAVGDLVLVKGFVFYPDGTFVAIEVELRSDDRLSPASGDYVVVEGFVEDFVSSTAFVVAGWPVTTTATTDYVHGAIGDLANGVLVKVKGTANASGVIVAECIAFPQLSTIRVVAPVTSIDVAARKITLLGMALDVDDGARFEDVGGRHVRDFGLDDVAIGDWLDVRGYEEPAGSDTVTLTTVMRVEPADSVQLRGPFHEPAKPAFHILSVPVMTNDTTRFLLEGDVHLTADQFFLQATGSDVEAWGAWHAPTLDASKVEIKLELP